MGRGRVCELLARYIYSTFEKLPREGRFRGGTVICARRAFIRFVLGKSGRVC